jgi:hypothetical protein
MRFRRSAGVKYGLLYLAVSLASSWPIFLGYVPLPVELITGAPLWGPLQGAVTFRQFGVMEDLVRSFYPGHRLIGEAIRSGTIPLWNPYVLNGYPMHAALAMAIFAPLTMLSYVLPIDAAWTIGMVARPVVAALGTALYARALGLRHAGALSAGFVFGWCGFQTGWAGQAMIDVSMWLPWVLLGVVRVAEAPTPARIALTALALAFAPLSGHPEIAAYVALMTGAQALVCLLWPRSGCGSARDSVGRWTVRAKALGGLAAVAILATLLPAIQTLPAVEWLPQLKRELVGTSDVMPGFYILNLVYRHLAASPLNGIGVYIPNGAMYAGLLALLMLPAALAYPRRRDVWLHVVVVLTALQFTFGWGPLVWLHHLSPVPIDFPKTRIILLADFSVAMLAGFGVAALTEPGRRVSRWLIGALGLAAVVLCGLLIWLPDAAPLIDPSLDLFSWPRFIFQGRPFSLALVLAGVLAILVPAIRQRRRPSGAVLCTLVAVDMLTFAYGHVPFSRTDTLLAMPPAVQFLQAHTDDSMRILATKNVIPYNWEAQFRLATPSGYLYLTRIATDVMAPITIGPDVGVIEVRLDRVLESRSPLIDFLGIKYLVSSDKDGSADQIAKQPDRFRSVYDDGSVQIFENLKALPRANLVPCSGIEVQEFTNRRISRVNSGGFDPSRAVVLEDRLRCTAPPSERSGRAVTSPSTEVVEADFNTYTVRANAVEPSLLVFADTYYVGWRAFVDDAEVPILRANHAFKAVQVGPGPHLVRFVFEPWSFKLGAMLSGVGLAIVLALLGWSGALAWRHRNRHYQGAVVGCQAPLSS